MAANLSTPIAVGGRSQGLTEAKDTLFGLSNPEGRNGLVVLLLLVAGLTAAYWRVLAETSYAWTQPQYSHGWIVPLIGLYVLWCRRPDQTERSEFTPVLGASAGIGVLLVAVGYFSGLQWLQGVGLAAAILGVLAVAMLYQPFAAMNSAWRIDWQSPLERVLIGGAAVSTLLVAIGYAGLLPPQPFLALMLLAVIGYGASLLVGSLASRSGPLTRTGGENWASLLTIIGTCLVWVQASQLDMKPLMRLCLVAALLGVFGLVGGRRLLRWSGPGVLFLVFMFPLPSIVEHTVLLKLQNIAAAASTIVLQIIGLPVYKEGSTMVIEGVSRLDVAEACSGLRMSTIFGAMTVAMVFLIRRPWWDKLTLLLSAIPVALVVNIIRIVATAMVFYVFPDKKDLHDSMHDLAGYAMMPLALGVLWLELTILSNLTIAEETSYQAPGASPIPRA